MRKKKIIHKIIFENISFDRLIGLCNERLYAAVRADDSAALIAYENYVMNADDETDDDLSIDDFKSDNIYGSVYLYGRAMSAYADEIGDLCGFDDDVVFNPDDLYELWIDRHNNYGLVNVTKAHQESVCVNE